MPDITSNMGLKKPVGNETFTRAAYNENLDILEANAETKTGAQAKVDALAGAGNTKTVKQIADAQAAHLADSVKHITSIERTNWNTAKTKADAALPATAKAADSAKLNGYVQGNANGNIPINNGTKNTNLQADLVDGIHFRESNGSLQYSTDGGGAWKSMGDFTGKTTQVVNTRFDTSTLSQNQTVDILSLTGSGIVSDIQTINSYSGHGIKIEIDGVEKTLYFAEGQTASRATLSADSLPLVNSNASTKISGQILMAPISFNSSFKIKLTKLASAQVSAIFYAHVVYHS